MFCNFKKMSFKAFLKTMLLMSIPSSSFADDICDIDTYRIANDVEIFNRFSESQGVNIDISLIESSISNCIYAISDQYIELLYSEASDIEFLSKYALYLQVHPFINNRRGGELFSEEYDASIVDRFLRTNVFDGMSSLAQSYYRFIHYHNTLSANIDISHSYEENLIQAVVEYAEAMGVLAPYNEGIRTIYVDFILNGHFLNEYYWNIRNNEYLILREVCGENSENCRENLYEYLQNQGIGEINILYEVACEGIINVRDGFFSLSVCP
jgi:hypothetical protein